MTTPGKTKVPITTTAPSVIEVTLEGQPPKWFRSLAKQVNRVAGSIALSATAGDPGYDEWKLRVAQPSQDPGRRAKRPARSVPVNDIVDELRSYARSLREGCSDFQTGKINFPEVRNTIRAINAAVRIVKQHEGARS